MQHILFKEYKKKKVIVKMLPFYIDLFLYLMLIAQRK